MVIYMLQKWGFAILDQAPRHFDSLPAGVLQEALPKSTLAIMKAVGVARRHPVQFV